MTSGAEWAEQARRLFDAVRAGAGQLPATGAGEHGGDDCRWCPVCQVAAVVRGERPEVTAALADVLTAAATALRSFAEQPEDGAGEAPGPRPGEQPGDGPAVQRIDIA
ncbi:hypothetical protein E9549_13140 [Blastococcus sp. MG754426]|uniref:hypothetical protein n=1 Tax=unclassified Blastococcus TaxID=2619396 RepID=UPI001EEF9A22|nr:MULTISPECIES: hypothetical protein [unclassified Blastococcus]MCF6508343.1 hypothetical protein [Blastococcus sp. MG754426]MCF6510925.1 hypothetical protein [Blastococcus sp. MG754427]MCF6733994.1 hypothetical protein [Blastococcus sp. KM273129]